MKKYAVILLVIFITMLVISACNRELCPAYSKADMQKSEHVG
jgi:hypothetical protein